MRYFGGLSVEQTAEVLKVSAATVHREWKTARGWLCEQLTILLGLGLLGIARRIRVKMEWKAINVV